MLERFHWTRTLTLAALLVLLTGACGPSTQIFLQKGHRENYAIQGDELRKVQFYLSDDLLAHGPGGGKEGVLVVNKGTPGLAVDSGPNWLRVRFSEVGEGAYFVTVEDASYDSAYFLATKVPGEEGLRRVRDLPESRLYVGDQSYVIVYGAESRLLIDNGDLKKLMEDRTHLEGVKRE